MHVIARHLDNALLNPTMTNMRRRDYIYASSLGFLTSHGVLGGCRRSEWCRLSGYPKEVPETAQGLRRARYGGACGDEEVNLAKRARIYVDDEVSVLDIQNHISGRIDLVVIDPEATTDPLIGIEIKSVAGYGARGHAIPDFRGMYSPRDKDLAQASFYAHFYHESIKRWVIRYIDRGDGHTHDQELAILDDGSISANNALTGRNINEVYAWANSVHGAWIDQVPPDKDFHLLYSKELCRTKAQAGEFAKTDTDKGLRGLKLVKGDWQCRYCNYVLSCNQDVIHPYDFTTQSALDHFLKK